MRLLGKHPAFGAMMLVFVAVGCANSALQETILIDYHRSGGIRGSDDHLVIKNDGTGSLTTGGSAATITVDADTFNRLQERLEAAGFSGLRANYEAPAGGADMYQYVIAYQGHTVRAQDASLPQALYPVIELLDRILQGG